MAENQFFFRKKIKITQKIYFFCIYLLVMPKYWGKQIPRSGSKAWRTQARMAHASCLGQNVSDGLNSSQIAKTYVRKCTKMSVPTRKKMMQMSVTIHNQMCVPPPSIYYFQALAVRLKSHLFSYYHSTHQPETYNYFFIFLLALPKYWGKQNFSHGSFPKVCEKQ